MDIRDPFYAIAGTELEQAVFTPAHHIITTFYDRGIESYLKEYIDKMEKSKLIGSRFFFISNRINCLIRVFLPRIITNSYPLKIHINIHYKKYLSDSFHNVLLPSELDPKVMDYQDTTVLVLENPHNNTGKSSKWTRYELNAALQCAPVGEKVLTIIGSRDDFQRALDSEEKFRFTNLSKHLKDAFNVSN